MVVRECHGCTTGAAEGYKMEMEFYTYGEYGEPLDLTQQFIAEDLANIGIKLDLSVVEGSVLWAASTTVGLNRMAILISTSGTMDTAVAIRLISCGATIPAKQPFLIQVITMGVT